MTAKHTPGPWTTDSSLGFRNAILGPHGLQVALVAAQPPFEPNAGNADANARLIAAAPALLDLVERALRGEDPKTWNPAARIAIKQARGEA